MTEPIRLLLVDDQRLMREGLHTLLEMEPGIEVAGEAANGQEALDAYARLQPDVVLMDVRMPVMDGVEATRRLRQRWPAVRVIILTTFDDDEYVFEGLRAGALGYLLKDVSMRELAEAIHTVMAGGVLIEPSVARKVVAERAVVGARDGDPAPAGPGTDQPRDRAAAVPGGRHCQKLRHQHPRQDWRARPDSGCAARAGVGTALIRCGRFLNERPNTASTVGDRAEPAIIDSDPCNP